MFRPKALDVGFSLAAEGSVKRAIDENTILVESKGTRVSDEEIIMTTGESARFLDEDCNF